MTGKNVLNSCASLTEFWQKRAQFLCKSYGILAKTCSILVQSYGILLFYFIAKWANPLTAEMLATLPLAVANSDSQGCRGVSRFLIAYQHIKAHLVPWKGYSDITSCEWWTMWDKRDSDHSGNQKIQDIVQGILKKIHDILHDFGSWFQYIWQRIASFRRRTTMMAPTSHNLEWSAATFEQGCYSLRSQ